MMNPENIPAPVFEWIKTMPFEQLLPAQKAEVLKCMDEQTYTDMHLAALAVEPLKTIPPAKGKTARKQVLLGRFDKHHREKNIIPIWRKPVALWKAAAVIVFLLGSFYVYTAARNEKPIEYVAQVDTVYVTKEIPTEPVKIHDTVYVNKYSKGSSKQNTEGNITFTTENGSMSSSTFEGTGVVPVQVLEHPSNQPKRNSMKDDTLLKKYTFVTM